MTESLTFDEVERMARIVVQAVEWKERVGRDPFEDKTTWGDGPWLKEPDRVEFEHKGIPCIIRRGPSGALCGYAAVNPGHPWHGRGYMDVPVEAHGGITYAEACAGDICHVPKPGEPDDVWWLGFDCAHLHDFMPKAEAGLPEHLKSKGDTYKDLAYVRAQTEQLAEQILEAA